MKKTILTIAITSLISLSAFAFEPDLTKVPMTKSVEPFKYLKREKVHRGYDKENVIKLKLIPLLLSTVSLQYERVLKENMSAACDVDFLFYSTSIPDASSLSNVTLTFSGFGLSPEFRFYPGGEAPKGFYVAPYLSYFSLGFKEVGKDLSSGATGSAEIRGLTAMGAGVIVGYQWLIGGVFSIETHLGASFTNMSTPSTITVKYTGQPDQTIPFPSFTFSGFLPTAGVQIGVAF